MSTLRRALLLLFAATPLPLLSQTDSAVALKPVVVTVTRGTGRTVLGSPFAITVVQPDSARPGQRHIAMDETLALIPGVTTVSRNNPSQDPRLSIRGFGARSAFGVRGIRVLRDGIPITLPDGQTPLDYVSLESIGRIEVLRGAASALYGNASGGVVDLRTVDPSASSLAIDGKQWVGSAATSRTALIASGTSGGLRYNGDAAYARSDGSRIHSSQRATTGFGRVAYRAGANEYAVTAMALNNPLAENPGALTIDEMRADPATADALSLRRNARKAVNQLQVGVSADRSTSGSELTLSAFGGARSLDNPLTFAVVEVGRHTWGASGAARIRRDIRGLRNSFAAGFDLQTQNDLRRNFAVCADTIASTTPTATCPNPGSDRGMVSLDQRERVSSAGVYAGDDIDFLNRFTLSGGIRADRVRFEVEDRLVSGSNPNDSGTRALSAISPVVGVLARISQTQSVYANISSAFETPTATELGNHADGSAGINPDLDPQRSYTTEIGAKGWAAPFLRYDLSLFDTRVRDELVPFEIPGSNGRRYFRNAGRTRRRGAEVGAEIGSKPVSLMLAYSYSRFRFVTFESGASNFAGNEIPGIPQHRLQSAIRISSGNQFAVLENEIAGRAFVDDANTTRAPGYAVTNARFGTTVARGSARGTLTIGAQNLFDRNYASSLAVNAARGKYFEPAAPRSIFAGLSIGTGH